MPITHRLPSRVRRQFAGALWILTVVYFAGQLVAQAAWRTPYSLLDKPGKRSGQHQQRT